jgi:hypothetical protein
MGNIYRSAQQVLLFAGSPVSTMIAAVLFITLFGGTYGGAFVRDTEDFRNAWRNYTHSQLKEYFDVPLPEEETWECVRHLLWLRGSSLLPLLLFCSKYCLTNESGYIPSLLFQTLGVFGLNVHRSVFPPEIRGISIT